MPRYRVNYIGRTEVQPGMSPDLGLPDHLGLPSFMSSRRIGLTETEFEDQVEAMSAARALDEFFSRHVERREDVKLLGSDGHTHDLEGVTDYDPRTIYRWMEDEMMMEYQGLEEMTPASRSARCVTAPARSMRASSSTTKRSPPSWAPAHDPADRRARAV